jgi:undecaprenyl diphosphate synthase
MVFKGKEDLISEKIPVHVAVIMDGNGRWARKKGLMRIFGHRNGVRAVRETVEAAAETGVKYLTLYAFSTENWNRPKEEVEALMDLLIESTHSEMETLMKNSIRLKAIGELETLPEKTRANLESAIKKTENNTRMTLILALSYSGRREIVRAAKNLADKIQSGMISASAITEEVFADELNTSGIPDPELMIRTSGEQRISNYLLWQLAYAELYFTDVLWPDFRKMDFFRAIFDFQNRERRFGKTGEQIDSETKPEPLLPTYNKTA